MCSYIWGRKLLIEKCEHDVCAARSVGTDSLINEETYQ